MKPAINERLDTYITKLLPSASRSHAASLIKNNKVSVNKVLQTKPSYRLKPSDKVKIDSEATSISVPKLNLPVIYEDNDCIIINKPEGILSHSKGNFNPEATVASWLSTKAPNMTGDRAGIIHRLDRATSGVMILAKTPTALSYLQKQFSQRKTKKVYIAIINGQPDNKEAIIDMPIERNPKKPQTFRVGANGKSAVTRYKIIESGNGRSLVRLEPTTGRTHQLRVHLKKINHPIVGDVLYGGLSANRLYLHALSLEITLSSGERKIFRADLPKQFKITK